MAPIRVKSRLACEMASLEPQKLNEAVFNGHLPCAGETKPGSARTFDGDGLVMLAIFSQMLKAGMSTAGAGRIACLVHSVLVRDPTESIEKVVVYLDPACHGSGDYPIRAFSASGVPVGETEGEALRFSLLFSDPRIDFPVGAMRKTARSAAGYQAEKNPTDED